MKTLFKILLYIIVYGAIFAAGFVIGINNPDAGNRIVITSQCEGSGVQKSYSAVFESRDGVVIRDEKIEIANYTTTCKCFASDKNHDVTNVANVEFSSSDSSVIEEDCAESCHAYCLAHLAGFEFVDDATESEQ